MNTNHSIFTHDDKVLFHIRGKQFLMNLGTDNFRRKNGLLQTKQLKRAVLIKLGEGMTASRKN